MTDRYLFASVTRISDLEHGEFDVQPLPRSQWGNADYIAVEVTGSPSALYRLELCSGRLIEAMEGTLFIGALGKREATLEAVGDWEAVTDDGCMDALTGAGLLGKATSVATTLPKLMSLRYRGHVMRHGDRVTMDDFVAPVAGRAFNTPTILLVGTSMSAGKTTTGRIIIHELKRHGLRVAGAKLTGAGRYRDVLSFQDAGADTIVDFVDAGLPSTVVSPERFQRAMAYMLNRISETNPDVLVAEAGASPLEPYNGEAAVAILGDSVCCTVLCASDPYAVVGVQQAFQIRPDIVTGPATNTEAGVALVKKLTGLNAINLIRDESLAQLLSMLRKTLPARLFAATEGAD